MYLYEALPCIGRCLASLPQLLNVGSTSSLPEPTIDMTIQNAPSHFQMRTLPPHEGEVSFSG